MSNVVVDREKIDLLANAISAKSGEPLTLTLDEMVEAVDGIETNPAPTLQSKTYTVDSAGTETITADNGYDGLSSVSVSVPSAEPWVGFNNIGFVTENNQRKWHARSKVEFSDGEPVGWMDEDKFGAYLTYNAIPTGTTITPTTSAQTIGGANYMMEGAVTVNPIPSQYIVPSGTINITSSGNTNVTNYATANVASGSATASATKGTVSNHQVSVTPSVTRTAGYITAGSANGTAVTVSASELVSGSQTITQNGIVDVTNLASVTVNVSGGGSSGMVVATSSATLQSANASISFTGLSGEPTSFVVMATSELATGASPYKTASVVFDGTDLHGQIVTNTNNAQASYSTSFTKSYSNGTLTITGTGTNFQATTYSLVYTYGGSSANIGTAETQVGSGATSVTFTGLTDEPDYFSCIFKSNFGTSSGYQRVMAVANDGSSSYGMSLDSSGKYSATNFSYTYNNGSLTISSQGTNAGGYFHQPGYYQLTYGIGGEAPEIEAEPLSVTENGTYTAPRGKAYTPVTVNVSSGGGASIGTKTVTNDSNTATTLSFTSMSGRPSAFFVRCQTQIQSSGSTNYYYVDNMRYNGTNTQGTYVRIGGTRGIYPDTTHYSYSYSGTTLTLTTTGSRTGAGGSFYNGTYELVYVY